MNACSRLFGLIAVLLFVLPAVTGAQLDVGSLTGQAESMIEEELLPVVKILASGLNSGLYAPVSGKVLAFGIQTGLNPFPDEGLFRNLESPFPIPVPHLYVGLNIPVVGICGFFRGLASPLEFKDAGKKIRPGYFGFGAGYGRTFATFIDIRGLAHFHTAKDLLAINVSSAGATAIASITMIPFLKPYAVLGMEYTRIKVPTVIPMGSGSAFTMQRVFPHAGLGIQFIKALTFEAYALPRVSFAVSLGVVI